MSSASSFIGKSTREPYGLPFSRASASSKSCGRPAAFFARIKSDMEIKGITISFSFGFNPVKPRFFETQSMNGHHEVHARVAADDQEADVIVFEKTQQFFE